VIARTFFNSPGWTNRRVSRAGSGALAAAVNVATQKFNAEPNEAVLRKHLNLRFIN